MVLAYRLTHESKARVRLRLGRGLRARLRVGPIRELADPSLTLNLALNPLPNLNLHLNPTPRSPPLAITGRQMKILTGGIMHESNTFTATLADRLRFEQGSLAHGTAVIPIW